jgi:hypothetical protein
MFAITDLGSRCDRHVGEVYAPRCGDCEVLNIRFPRAGYTPGSQCSKHPDYPLPCASCARDHT